MLINIAGITNWLELTLIALATYRLALMLSTETGAFGVFDKFRVLVTKHFPGKPILTDNPVTNGKYYRQHWLTEGVNCPLCVGFWLSPVCASLWISEHLAAQGVIVWLAIAGLQTFFTKVSSGNKD